MYQRWIQKALNKGFSDLEILINENKILKICLENQKIEHYVESKIIAVSLKGIYQNQISEVYIENLNDYNFDYMLDLLKQNTTIITTKEPAMIFEGSKIYPNIVENNFHFVNISFSKKITLLKELEKLISKSIFFKKTEEILYKEVFNQKKLINSKGINLESANSYAYLYGSSVFERNNDIQSHGELQLVKDFKEFNLEKQAQKIISLGEKKLCGKSLKSATYPTVFSNEMFAVILESFSNVFSAENAYRSLTKLKNKLNQLIASPKINLIDDPLSDLSYFKEKFDDQGIACYRKNIVEKGVFKCFVNNLKMAKIFNQQPTGNFFDGNIMMTNFYLQKGNKSLDKMISGIQNGVYITDLIGLHTGIQIVSGDFSLQASGFKIENGKITFPLKMIVISGNFFDILKNLKEIADDFEFQLSGFGSASVYVGSLTIGGNE